MWAMKEYVAIRPQTNRTSITDLIAGCPAPELGPTKFIPGPSGLGPEEVEVLGITVSTSDLENDWAFVGIPGTRHHGARFSIDAANSGAALIITDQDGVSLAEEAGLPILVVNDPRSAAGILSQALYGDAHQALTLVGVTGTNGKTTTTYFVRAALEPKFGHGAVLGTVELDTGSEQFSNGSRTTQESPVVHRALAYAAENGTRAGVVEVSSHAMSLDRVKGLTFDVSLFTNLQHDHLDYYKTMDRYLEAKAMLFAPEVSKRGVVVVDDQYGRQLAREAAIPVVAVQVLTDDDPDIGDIPLWHATNIQPDMQSGGSSFQLESPEGTKFQALSPIPGPANVQDAAVALVGAAQLGVPMEDAIAALSKAPAVPGRMQWIPSNLEEGPRVLVDYAHTPEGVQILLDVIRELTPGRIIAVFGTDGDRDATKRAPLAKIFAKNAEVLWVTDENPRWEDPVAIRKELLDAIKEVRPQMEDVIEVTTSRRDAIREAIRMGEPGDLVVITGKGAEPYQEYRGVFHQFLDSQVAEEVVRDLAKK